MKFIIFIFSGILGATARLFVVLPRPDCFVFDAVVKKPSKLCPALHKTLSRMEHVGWPPVHLQALRSCWSRIPVCPMGAQDAAGNPHCTLYVTGFSSEVVRFAKMTRDQELFDALIPNVIALVRSEVRQLQDVWQDLWETPYTTSWKVSLYRPQHQSPPKGLWNHNEPFIRRILAVLPEIWLNDVSGLEASELRSPEEAGRQVVNFWSSTTGWELPNCNAVPSLCMLFRHLLPSTSTSPCYGPEESLSLQWFERGGYVLSNNSPERVKMLMCLGGCEAGWFTVAGTTRAFGYFGAVEFLDGAIDHAIGNNGTGTLVLLVLGLAHPEHARLAAPVPTCSHPARGYYDLPHEDALIAPFETTVDSLEARMLGGPDSAAVLGLKWMGRHFDCRATGRSFPRLHPGARQLARYVFQSYMRLEDISWEDRTVQLREEMADLPLSAVELSQRICRDLKALLLGDLQVATDLQRSWVVEFGKATEVQETLHGFSSLGRWEAADRREESARRTTADLINHRLHRLVQEGRSLTDSNLWPDLVAKHTAVTLEALFTHQFVNAYAATAVGVPPLPPLRFFDELGDRVAVMLAALGEEAQRPETLLVEIGVFRGLFALSILRRSAMKYVGFDDYNPRHVPNLYNSVRGMLKAEAGERAELHRLTSEEGAAVSLPTASGLADHVFIDGEHEYVALLKDLRIWWPRVKPGGYIFGHDLCVVFPGVAQAVAEFCAEQHCDRVNIGLDTLFWIQKPP